jgi:hypothetical protein
VNAPVDLNAEAGFGAVEVQNKAPDAVLAAKPKPAEAPRPNDPSELALGRRRVLPQVLADGALVREVGVAIVHRANLHLSASANAPE